MPTADQAKADLIDALNELRAMEYLVDSARMNHDERVRDEDEASNDAEHRAAMVQRAIADRALQRAEDDLKQAKRDLTAAQRAYFEADMPRLAAST